MAIKISKSFEVKQPIEAVWAFLSDPRKVAACVPGAQITEQIDESHYKGTITVKVGPAVTDFKGEVELVGLDPQAHEIELVGKGQDIRGKGSASMKMTGSLRSLPDGGTEIVSESEVNVVGILAQMGGRVINEVSNIMFEKFSKNFQEKLQQEVEQGTSQDAESGAAKPINAVSLAFSAIKASMKRNKAGSESGPEPEAEKAAEDDDQPKRKAQ
jgi:uncharacterized protein